MPTMRKAAKVTCEVYQSLSAPAQSILAALRVDWAQVQARRMVALGERMPLPFLPPATRLEEDPAEACEVYLPAEHARAAVMMLAHELRLFTAGRGAVYAEEVELFGPPESDPCSAGLAGPGPGEHPGERLSRYSLINCVVQRGHGNRIARSVLETGANVPSIYFGVGTGVRDRLGLLRIAIPADKEVVSMLVDAQDQHATLETLVDAGRLDQPGRGFVAAYPVPCGVANPMTFRGRQRHGATMEQVIAAIDDLKSGTDWRRRSWTSHGTARTDRGWLKHLVNVALNCNEGSSDRLAAIVMAAGAGGATISKAKLFSPSGKDLLASPARAIIDFSFDPDRVDALVQGLREGGAFDRESACFVEIKPLSTAFTYVAA